MAGSPPTADVSDWTRLDALLDRALDLDGADRDAFIESLDPGLREAILLGISDDPFLDHPEAAHTGLAEETREAVAEGTRVGPYAIEALVGEGGMGRVYRARRADGAFEQTVAVKVVRQSLALAGSDVSARLRRERDLLAALDHPSIARLIDGGETEDGVPYLVTEFIDGAPITTWAHDRQLGVRERVRLVAEVARAVDHAHRRFIVHRDLKPGNVLVTERDGAARPVVLDFGIAKLFSDAGDEGTGGFPLTRTGLRLLTPAYAAPELFDPTVTATTAADVYGLGALLYELLTGQRPTQDPTAPGLAPTETARPSRVVTVSEALPSRARDLRGDLDTICLKALHLDPARRYGSAAELANDLERYLTGRPVEARPDSLAYVAGRFARRHRTAVASLCVALVALVGGLTFSVLALAGEREARAEAEAARVEAESNAERATEAADLLASMFRTASPDYDDGREVTSREALAIGVERVNRVESVPLRAYLLRVLATTYIEIGDPAKADSLLQASLDLIGRETTSAEASVVRRHLAATRDAMADPPTVLELGNRLYRDHRDDPDVDHALVGLYWVSRASSRMGRSREALAAAERARAMLPSDASARQRALISQLIADLLLGSGDTQAAIPHLDEAIRQTIDDVGRHDPRTMRLLSILGSAYGTLGEFETAEALLREAITFDVARYGADRVSHRYVALAHVRLQSGRFREAAAVLDSALTVAHATFPPDHPEIGDWHALRAQARIGSRAFGGAERDARAALARAAARGDAAAAEHASRLLATAQRREGSRR